MRKLLFHILALTLVFFLASCEKENMGDCFKSSGKTVIEERAFNAFRGIVLDDGINLYIEQSSTHRLAVEAGENLQSLIETKIEGGILKISNQNTCNWVRSYSKDINVYLSISELDEIVYYGAGEIRFTNRMTTDFFKLECWEASGNIFLDLNCKEAEIKSHTGPTDIYAMGVTNKLIAYNNGVGGTFLENLNAQDVFAVNNNIGKLRIQSDSLLTAFIHGDGDLELRGEPEITLTKTGKGNLIKIE